MSDPDINIRWYSPLDPLKTEIGRYSQALLPSLQRLFSLELVADAAAVEECFTPENHALGMEPVSIYNLGNSFMHCGILDLALRQPGVVIMHDVSLLELGLAYARENPDFNLREVIVREYGIPARKAFSDMYRGRALDWCGDNQEQYDNFITTYPLFETFIKNAAGVVVHSDYAFERVSEKYRGHLVKLDLPYDAPEIDDLDMNFKPPLQIIFCGHAGPNRRLMQFIDAWSKVRQPGYFRLNLYGNIDKAEELLSRARELGLAEFINVVGFVEEDTLTAAVSGSDLALNLRNPTVGEASASQLRYWSSAIPSIVSDVGWYSELPDNTVIKVSTTREQEDLIAVLEGCIAGDQTLLGSGEKGYRYLCEQHNIARYTEGLVSCLEQVAENRFAASIFDNRLIDIMASLCDDVNDSRMFEPTLSRLSGIVGSREKM